MINTDKLNKKSTVTLTFIFIRLCDMAKICPQGTEKYVKLANLISGLGEYLENRVRCR